MIAEASLSFLGLGQQPPAPSWGSMLNTARNYVDQAPWMAIWPGVSIFLLVLSFNLLGDGCATPSIRGTSAASSRVTTDDASKRASSVICRFALRTA